MVGRDPPTPNKHLRTPSGSSSLPFKITLIRTLTDIGISGLRNKSYRHRCLLVKTEAQASVACAIHAKGGVKIVLLLEWCKSFLANAEWHRKRIPLLGSLRYCFAGMRDFVFLGLGSCFVPFIPAVSCSRPN